MHSHRRGKIKQEDDAWCLGSMMVICVRDCMFWLNRHDCIWPQRFHSLYYMECQKYISSRSRMTWRKRHCCREHFPWSSLFTETTIDGHWRVQFSKKGKTFVFLMKGSPLSNLLNGDLLHTSLGRCPWQRKVCIRYLLISVIVKVPKYYCSLVGPLLPKRSGQQYSTWLVLPCQAISVNRSLGRDFGEGNLAATGQGTFVTLFRFIPICLCCPGPTQHELRIPYHTKAQGTSINK
jgi:hypothetical protein